MHQDQEVGIEAGNTLVLLHDACFGHRYSRPKTSKAALGTIFERPERITAGMLGIASAYVRLGEKHAGGRSAPHPQKEQGRTVPFKIRRTSRALKITSPAVTNVHGTIWMDELNGLCIDTERKLATTGKELVRQNRPQDGQQPKESFHEGDLYLAPGSLDAFEGALGGVCDGVDAIFEGTRTKAGPSHAFVCIRPPGHHCSADWPSGFCWLNNVHVGIQHAALNHGLTHAAIIDFDLHHGDGSQDITWKHNTKVSKLAKNANISKKTAIGYFSLHDINSYPCEWGEEQKVQNASLCIENAHGQSIWNVHLQPWKTEVDFWKLYETRYMILIDKARAFLKSHYQRLRSVPNGPQPKAAIFLSAGFDASEWENPAMQRHKVNVPTEFYARFTQDVVALAREEGTGVDDRVISVLEGGYSDRALTSGVLSHLCGLCNVPSTHREGSTQDASIELQQGVGSLGLNDGNPQEEIAMQSVPTYNAEWWHASNLALLEHLVEPPPPPTAPKKPKKTELPTYQTPTQSFTAKVVDPAKVIRSISGTMRPVPGLDSPSRAPTPPPPDVDWFVAAHELSKLLLPTDRPTRSMRYDELTEPKIKKERASIGSIITTTEGHDATGRQLRDRKSKVPAYQEPASDDDRMSVVSARSVSRSDRRKTLADPMSLEGEITENLEVRPRSVSRRLSTASSVSSMAVERPAPPSRTVSGSRRNSVAPAESSTTASTARKPRAPTAAEKVTVPRARGPGRPPVPRIPTGFSSAASNAARAVEAKENSAGGDMDKLTSGLKRITLKVPSKEEHDVRQQQMSSIPEADGQKKPAATTAKASASRKTAAPRNAKSAATARRGATRPGHEEKASAPEAQPGIPAKITASTPPLEQPAPVDATIKSHLPLITGSAANKLPYPPSQAPPAITSANPVVPAAIQPFADLPAIPDIHPQSSSPPDNPADLPATSFTENLTLLRSTTSPPRPDTPPPPPPSAHVQQAKETLSSPPTLVPARMSNEPSPGVEMTIEQVMGDAPLGWGVDAAKALDVERVAKEVERQKGSGSGRLPTFSSTGVIPFGTGAEQKVDEGMKSKAEKETVWDVPETPAKQ